MVRIAVDAMGGDRGPAEIVAGALDARGDGIEIVLFGDPSLETRGLELHPTSGVIEMHDLKRAVAMAWGGQIQCIVEWLVHVRRARSLAFGDRLDNTVVVLLADDP